MSNIHSVTQSTFGPKAKDFTDEELKLIDIDGLLRHFLTIKFKDLTHEVYFTLRDIAKSQYALPMKYLKPVLGTFSYVSQKAQLVGNEKDIRNAAVTIEPLNLDVNNAISYTPINQSLPLHTIVTINVKTDFDTYEDGSEPERRFIWSNNLETETDIEDKIKQENPKSISTKPWIGCCHYCAIDIGSQLISKYSVENVDTSILKSFSLFGFKRNDDEKEFVIWTYNCYNVLPVDVLKMICKLDNVEKESVKIIEEIIDKCK